MACMPRGMSRLTGWSNWVGDLAEGGRKGKPTELHARAGVSPSPLSRELDGTTNKNMKRADGHL